MFNCLNSKDCSLQIKRFHFNNSTIYKFPLTVEHEVDSRFEYLRGEFRFRGAFPTEIFEGSIVL